MTRSRPKPLVKALANAIAPYRKADGIYRIGASFRCLLARVKASHEQSSPAQALGTAFKIGRVFV